MQVELSVRKVNHCGLRLKLSCSKYKALSLISSSQKIIVTHFINNGLKEKNHIIISSTAKKSKTTKVHYAQNLRSLEVGLYVTKTK
jgi:hypothetical protein